MIDAITAIEVMEYDPEQFAALVWVDDQCEGCPLANQCDPTSRELCSGALEGDCVSD